MGSFCTDILLPKKLPIQTVTREKLRKTLSYKKGANKMGKNLLEEVTDIIEV